MGGSEDNFERTGDCESRYVLVAKLQDRNKELDQANETIIELREGMANVNCEMDRVRVVNRDQKETIDLQDLALLSNERTIAELRNALISRSREERKKEIITAVVHFMPQHYGVVFITEIEEYAEQILGEGK